MTTNPPSDTVSMLRAFDWLESKGVKIVNMSLSGPPDELIRKAIEKLTAKGMIFIAAAGNEGPTSGPSYPAAYDQVIAVTAVNKALQNYRYANRGTYIDFCGAGSRYLYGVARCDGRLSLRHFICDTVRNRDTRRTLSATRDQNTRRSDAAVHCYRPWRTRADPVYGQGLVRAPSFVFWK